MGQVLGLQELIEELTLNRKGRKVVFTNGCFDILHVGHIRYLQEAKKQGDILIVGLNSDSSVKKLKGDSRPVQVEADRAEILSALDCIDYVTFFSQETPQDLISAIEPDVLVKGGDWPIDKIVGSDTVLAKGGEVKSLQFVNGKSTTGLIEKILKI